MRHFEIPLLVWLLLITLMGCKGERAEQTDDTQKITEVVLNKIIAGYKSQFEAKNVGPANLSIAFVDKYEKGSRGSLSDKNIRQHWLYENGKLAQSTPSRRQEIIQNKTYINSRRFFKTGIATFAIYREEGKTLVQIDVIWSGDYGHGELYEVLVNPEGELSLELIGPLWVWVASRLRHTPDSKEFLV